MTIFVAIAESGMDAVLKKDFVRDCFALWLGGITLAGAALLLVLWLTGPETTFS